MPKLKMLALSLLAVGLWTASASAQQAVEATALTEADLSAALFTVEENGDCQEQSNEELEMSALPWERMSDLVLMSSEEVREHQNHEASCYTTGSDCESCGNGKVRYCTYYRCWCSCSGSWYTTKSCTSCRNFC